MKPSPHLSEDLLNSWVDGAATNEEESIIQEHLNTCALCRKELDSLNAIKAALYSLPQPTISRSFQLTAEHVREAASSRDESSPSKLLQLLPVVRMLSIAAVITFLVLGGSLAFGPVSDTLSDDSDRAGQMAETDQSGDASQRENLPAPMAAVPGDIVDQGDSASSTSSMMDALDAQPSNVAADDEGLSLLAIATMTAAGLSVIFMGLWVLLSRMGQHQLARKPRDRSGTIALPGRR